jgi:starch-binding outer membrane protein, SusD/RagB family
MKGDLTMTFFSIRRSAGLLLAALTLSGGCAPSDVLDVQDPDIINPADVQSPAGADAVRLGALARFTSATSGAEGLFLLGGLFADEWVNGDSFIARQEIDQRVITIQNNFLTDANRVLHRARLSAQQAIELLEKYNPSAPAYQVAEMYFVQAYVINMMAEHYCDGLIFSDVVAGREEYGSPITTAAAFNRALTLANDGLALITGTAANDLRVRYALMVTKGRILLNLNQPAQAALAVAGVPTSYAYSVQHSQTTQINTFWNFNNNARRYSVSASEGANGLNYATANDPRVPVCLGGTTACTGIGVTQNRRDDLSQPLYVQMIWTARESAVAIVKGVEARLIEAEAQLRTGDNGNALIALNTARATITGLAPLLDPGSADARIDQLFRERAFWMFGTGHRVGDMRRLIRQYNRPATSVFPTGAWHKGGNYGADVTVPVPQAEQNNPNLPSSETCMNRNA